MQAKSIKIIEEGLTELVSETRAGNESLIRRAKVLDAVGVMSKSLQLHTQRRLTGKLNADPNATVRKIFRKFNETVEVIK